MAAPSSLEKLRSLPCLHPHFLVPFLYSRSQVFPIAIKMEEILEMATCDRMDWWSLPSPASLPLLHVVDSTLPTD